MDAVEFLKERKRMCLSLGESCAGCPLNGTDCANTSNAPVEIYKKNVEAVEQWAKDHPNPVKTRQSEFLQMFPNALIVDEETLVIYPCEIDKTIKLVACSGDCTRCRRDYWLQEVE